VKNVPKNVKLVPIPLKLVLLVNQVPGYIKENVSRNAQLTTMKMLPANAVNLVIQNVPIVLEKKKTNVLNVKRTTS
jgi:hypothetical protein